MAAGHEQERLNGAVETGEQPDKSCPRWVRLSTTKKIQILAIGFLSLILLFLLCLTISAAAIERKEPVTECLTRDCIESAGAISGSLDPTHDPCQDFYKFACSGFLKANRYFSPNYLAWLPNMMLTEAAKQAVRNTLEMAPEKSDSKAIFKMKLSYLSCLISLADRSERASLKKLKTEIKKLDLGEWPYDIEMDLVPLENIVAMMHVLDSKHLFKLTLAQDKDAWFYKMSGIFSENYDEGQILLIADLLELLEVPYPRQTANEIAALEQELHVGSSGPTAVDDIYDIENLSALYPSFDWARFFLQVFSYSGYKGNIRDVRIQVVNKVYVRKLFEVLGKTSSKRVRNYLMLQFVLWSIKFLGPSLRHVNLIRELPVVQERGPSVLHPHWEICQAYVGLYFDRPLTAEYVRIYFSDDMQREIQSYLDNIKNSFKDHIPLNDWLDKWTQKSVEEKINDLSVVIGYPPDVLKKENLDKRYANVEIDENSLLHNMVELRKNYMLHELEYLAGETKEERTWEYSPTNINAFNSRNDNLIVIPLSILYPPNFQIDRPKYLNYGAIGSVIAHELGHAFDNEGIVTPNIHSENFRFLNWSSTMVTKFMDRAQCIVDQYSNFVFKEFDLSIKVNGTISLNNDIADHVGLLHSYLAYKNYEKTNGMEPGLPGLNYTNDQLFFIQNAQTFCTTYTIMTATFASQMGHSPGEFRVNGPIANNPYFGDVFNCPLGSPMNPVDKCELWV